MNLNGSEVYSHSTQEGRKNHNGMVKRKIIALGHIMEPLWERCGIPSVYMFYSELQGFRTVWLQAEKDKDPSSVWNNETL